MLIGLASNGIGCSKESPDFKLLGGETFAVDFTKGLTPIVDAGNGYVYTRGAAGGTITDLDGLVKDVGNDEVMVDGVRRVRNLVTSSEDLQDTSSYAVTASTTIDSATQVTIGTGGNFGVHINPLGIPTGRKIVMSFTVSVASGTDTFRMGSLSDFSPNITATTTPTRVAYGYDSDAILNYLIAVDSSQNGGTFTVTNIQVEYVDGQTVGETGVPSEYVSVGVGTGSELFTDPDMDIDIVADPVATSSVDWLSDPFIDGQTFSISGGILTSGGFETISSHQPFKEGHLYYVEYTHVGGATLAGANLGGSAISWSGTGNGTFSQVVRCGSTNDRKLQLVFGTNGVQVSSIRIQEVDHGSNIDGSKYHNDDNRNTVASNVVTEADGKNIQPGVAKGYSCWETRDNYTQNSEDHTDTNSYSLSLMTAKTGSATEYFDGTSKDWTFVETASLGYHVVSLKPSLETGAGNSVESRRSFYVRANGRSYITLWHNVLSTECSFNLATGQKDTSQATTLDAEITHIRNGIYRIDCYSRTQIAGAAVIEQVDIYLSDSTTPYPVYLGDVTKGIDVGGSMAEIGAFVTPYIQTSGSTVTRPDSLLEYGVENYSDEMTVFFEFHHDSTTNQDYRMLFYASDDSYNTACFLGIDSNGKLWAYSKEATLARWDALTSNALTDGFHKVAVTYSATGSGVRSIWVDGAEDTVVQVGTDDDYSAGYSITKFPIGAKGDDTLHFDGHIKNVRIWSSVLSDALLAEYSTL